MKPDALVYKLDSFSINFYARVGGRKEQAVIAAIQWNVKLPREKFVMDGSIKYHDVSVKETFPTYEEALDWIEKNIEGEDVTHGV